MRRLLTYTTFLIALLAFSSACVREDLVGPAPGEGSTWVDIPFGYRDFEEVRVETKATLDPIPESRVTNMYVFMFLGEKRIFSHYFDRSSRTETLQGMREAVNEAWYVEQYVGNGSQPTHGAVHVRVPYCQGAEIYIVANIDADMVNISPEKLNFIATKAELKSLIVTMNQEITSRNGLFPMAGLYRKADGSLGYADVLEKGGIVPSGTTSGAVSVELERLDAKVQVNVRVATDNELTLDNDGDKTVQRLKSFNPESWQVVRLPKSCYLTPHKDGSGGDSDKIEYFSTEPVIFETTESQEITYRESTTGEDKTVTSTVHGFSFYMLENHVEAKHSVYTPQSGDESVSAFHRREKKNKNAAGQFDPSNGVWTYAPENGTYLVIKGEVSMDVDVESEAKQQQLSADVTYYVHLGDFGKSTDGSSTVFDNYSINRNTSYTYNITIKGVNSIELEVSTSVDSGGDGSKVTENEPGAEGMVYIAKESAYTFDAHYGQRVFCFDAAYIDPETVTWYVKTPFGREGTPDKIGDTEIPSGMDYEWVQFELNREADSREYSYTTDGGTSHRSAELEKAPFSHNNRWYPGDNDESLMNVVELVEYIKTQTRALKSGKENGFRREFDQDWFDWYRKTHPELTDPETLVDGKPGPWFRDRIYVTAFVNEFYYETDPITGEASPELWKRFVNQPNRLMHLLCDNEKSLDGASSSTGSVVTIRQRSIQTPYSIDDSDLHSAWGCETDDENADSYLWYYPEETDSRAPSAKRFGNSSTYNGLYNTVRIWGCLSSSGTGGTSWVDRKWSDFLDYDRPNDYVGKNGYDIQFLRDDMACHQYSAVMRNRDNNGNGIIDPDEIRWYSASIGQLEFLFFGELGLTDDATIYTRKYSDAGKNDVFPAGHPYAGTHKWASHIISSTVHSNGNPQILWAEESVSVSAYKQWTTERAVYTTKCIRNLGFETDTKEAFYNDTEADRPQDIIVMTRPDDASITASSVYKFDARRINTKSKRFRTTIELEPYDENSEMARLYNGFETGPLITGENVGVSSYIALRAMLQAGKSPCPEGYRVPNIREVTVMYLFTDSAAWWGGGGSDAARIYTSTYYSLGTLGNAKNEYNGGTPRVSWNTSSALLGGNINLNGYASRKIRCVRDWDPE